jgi:two-component system, NarL family, response regulator LiaR
MDTVKVLLADDQELARLGMRFALESQSSFEILGESENGEEAVGQALALHPDVILMDIRMPLVDGIMATQRIKAQAADIKVIILTSEADVDVAATVLASGADAYCLKDIKTERLIQIIELVKEGAIFLDPSVAHGVMQTLPLSLNRSTKPTLQKKQAYNTDLTPREVEVLEGIVAGQSNKSIAENLSITANTVKVHVCNIIQKLQVDDRTQAAVKALREGLVTHHETKV